MRTNIYSRVIYNNLYFKRYYSKLNSSLARNLKLGNVTYYDVLQVPQNATQDSIKKAYLKLVKEYHPDRNKLPESRSIFICIKEAHDTLSDKRKRAVYDSELRRKRNVLNRPIKHDHVGWRPSENQADDERLERYKRYTSGIRNDGEDDQYIWIKTIFALIMSCVTVFVLCLLTGDVFMVNKMDDPYVDSDVKSELMVNTYYNPIREKWERIIEPYEAPPPHLLKKYYNIKDDDTIPTHKLTTIEMPYSSTTEPTLLYDRKSSKLVVLTKN